MFADLPPDPRSDVTTPPYPRRVALALLTLALSGLACGGDDDAPDTAADATADATDGADGTADAPAEMFDTQFAQVCRDTGQPAAAEYVAGEGVHPVLVMRSDDGTEFHSGIVTLPTGWGAVWPELESTQLVACARRVSATPVEVCEGYEDDDSGLEWTVQTYDVVYEYDVRVARTAEVLGSQTFEVPAGSCPMISSYTEGAPQPVPYHPMVRDGELELFVRPFVTGTGAAAEGTGNSAPAE